MYVLENLKCNIVPNVMKKTYNYISTYTAAILCIGKEKNSYQMRGDGRALYT